MFCGECGSSTSATPESRRRPDPRPGDTTVIERPSRRNSGVISIPVHGFRIGDEVHGAAVPDRADAATVAAPDEVPARVISVSLPRFVLSFSTGETRTVFGTGLIGRKPLPQPGEEFDHLVQMLNDPDPAIRRSAIGAIEDRVGLKFSKYDPDGSATERGQEVARIRAMLPKWRRAFEDDIARQDQQQQ